MEARAKPVGNLSPHAASKRLLFGVGLLAVALAVAVGLHEAQVARPWRLVLFIPFAFSANGFFQGLYRT